MLQQKIQTLTQGRIQGYRGGGSLGAEEPPSGKIHYMQAKQGRI